ncbi:MAG TPA: DUF4249 family protein [Chitinophagaceae bacterium]|nr:DUF4249 family protein [Chitinophagaceae bacterium]
MLAIISRLKIKIISYGSGRLSHGQLWLINCKKNIVTFPVFIIFFLIFSSCEKVINIDLKKAESKYVIEAYVSNEPGDCKVHITQTVNFSDPADFPGVPGAVVTMQDDNNTPVALVETGYGMYESKDINGTEDHTYSLLVKVNGQVFTSVSQMPKQVNFDSLSIVDFRSFDGNRKFANVTFDDPSGKGNAYRFLQYKNEILNKNIFVLNDDFTDGRINNSLLTYFDRTYEERIETGDSIKVEMQCVDFAVYKFFSSLSQSSTGSSDNVSPGNPVSNIQGGALGYFSAYTKQKKIVLAK